MNIRQAWLDYYYSKGFQIIPSAPLVHPLFPTSFNMSAGLIQLDPKIRSLTKLKPYKQCLVQKCFRNFDIHKIGDKSHLSFFEMTGSFEVGEFNETNTISVIWEFLTQILKIDPNRIYITFFDSEIIVDRKIALSEELKKYLYKLNCKEVVIGNKDTNLWTQGGGANLTDNIKLCGPQIEFFYDLGIDKNCGNKKCNPFCRCGRFLEIANTILIKYYLDFNEDTKLKDLINSTTETVIGIERTALVVENKADIFETSYFEPITKVIPIGKLNEDIKIIVDHIKSLVFILSEQEITPTKSNRGRIIRTLIRELLTSFYILNISIEKYIPLLVDKVIEIYFSVYPELINAKNIVYKTIIDHEKNYKKTLDLGRRKILDYMNKNKIVKLTELNKKYIWEYFGVPIRLIDHYL